MVDNAYPPVDIQCCASSNYLVCLSNCSTSYSWSDTYVAYNALPCVDFSPTLGVTITSGSYIVNLTNTAAHFSIMFNNTNGWRTLTSVTAGGSGAPWQLECDIDIRLRPDNGLINTPPTANIISPIKIPVNVQETIQWSTFDADGDDIRCRWATGAECGGVCKSLSTYPAGTNLTSNCALNIKGTAVGTWYALAIMVEDFVNSTSFTALSSVPLQFLISVINASCLDPPDIIPLDQSCIGVKVGVNYTYIFYAISNCGSTVTISDIATQSFTGLRKIVPVTAINSTLYYIEVQWTPSASQTGSQTLSWAYNHHNTALHLLLKIERLQVPVQQNT
ncbi:unnamed protein product [Didymodactylos carnosus]|uniref:Uncharacterized protein n=1 Tax=Didymodactylos carnosus TaxID=1234261 RepID=A0A815ABW9_9BILA|nr:unnamed protein product [Didymodactylos carnosus]CAF4027529.1 unnamed protein product [Didymodactylos carnosus]